MYMHFGKMGIGPWYRIGLSMSNAVILAAIIETIISCNAASHSLAYSLAKYQYGLHGHAPGHLPTEVANHPQWVLFGVTLFVQILADILLWIAVIVKGNRHFALIWVMATLVRTSYTAVLHTFTQEEWERSYPVMEAIQKITAFLWGTMIFGFCAITGVQASYYLSTEEGRAKISPVGEGILALRDYYRENLVQLAVVLLFSEIVTNIHRCFHYPITAYLDEAKFYLGYTTAPDEMGFNISIATIVINAFGLILLTVKYSGVQKAWVVAYVILILVHLLLLAYVAIDWSPVNVQPHMFNGFFLVSVAHLIYKVGILYVYYKSMGQIVERRESQSASQQSVDRQIGEP
ncbi:uncharacterized protein LOC110856299 [Folsomia candida]|uniref:Uncharacterized protein n=1 Tax=Folsomia candida TaxID=158441 RepID=A0A226DQE2_FOLCA|nr:uncharacterized protein LOC110856299 [Folsomia candida]OXA46426.1 hypothetical protein Fcan01_18701 [Folsomia candida]